MGLLVFFSSGEQGHLGFRISGEQGFLGFFLLLLVRGVTWLAVNAASSRVTWVLLLLFMRGTWVAVTTGEQSYLDFSCLR
jgi:hypothetical protein